MSQGNSRRVSLLTENLLNQVVTHWKKLLAENEFLSAPLLVAKQLKYYRQNSRNFTQGKNNNSQKVLSPPRERSLLAEAEYLLLRKNAEKFLRNGISYQPLILEKVKATFEIEFE